MVFLENIWTMVMIMNRRIAGIFRCFGLFLLGALLAGTLSCSDDEPATGPRGELGLECYANGSCNEGLNCGEDGVCQECAPGLEGCGCAEFWGCDDGLVCQRDVCVPFTCEAPGQLGCACDLGQTCADGLTCSPNGQCLECSSDLAGCACSDSGTCGDGLVCNADQTCERDPTLGVRLVDECYTPCRNDIVDNNGERRHCSAQGMMRGCVGGTVCVEGSCVPEGHGARLCKSDANCPDFQTCELGQCYSTCQGNNDCGGGAVCQRHVCRIPCSADASSCAQGEFCNLVDGVAGFCMPLGTQEFTSADAAPLPTVYAQISVDNPHFGFAQGRSDQQTRLSNHGSFSESFVIRKARHVANRDLAESTDLSNEQVVTFGQGEVMPWLTVSVAEVSRSDAQQLDVTLEAGEVTNLVLHADLDQAPERWEGEIEIIPAASNVRMAPLRLFLNYKGSPQGRWEGNAYYFASFGTKGLDEWLLDKNAVSTDSLGNAFIRQWRKFVESQSTGRPVPYTSFQEVLTATLTESWNWPSVKQICPPSEIGDEAICYLSGVSQGFQYYTQSPATNPVPSGVTELPVALNLRTDATQDLSKYVGRIDSTSSLHYPGNPQINLSFAADPATCPTQGGSADSTCVVQLESMRATSIVAGRYGLGAPDEQCASAAFERNFERAAFPWLVPGFLQATEFDPDLDSHFKYECRGQKYPWGPGEVCQDGSCAPMQGSVSNEERMLNALLSQANPVPDGLQRVRRIELVDGALIDGNKMLIIFRETLESFMGANRTDEGIDFENYGFMLLHRTPAALEAQDYQGVDLTHAAPVQVDEAQLTYQCSAEFVDMVAPGASFEQLEDAELQSLAEIMLDGRVEQQDIEDLLLADDWHNRNNAAGERVHYLCKFQQVDAGDSASGGQMRTYGVFDSGASGNFHCPESAQIVYFTLDGVSDATLQNLACNQSQDCHNIYNQWVTGARTAQDFGDGDARSVADVLRTDIHWECANSASVERECSPNRYNMRQGKNFYEEAPTLLFMKPIEQEIAQAFRFRLQFLSRDNTAVGFAPDICAPNPNTTPFCYDPAMIEELRARTDCLLALYNHERDALGEFSSGSLAARVRNYLTRSFSSQTLYRINGNPNGLECTPGAASPACQPVDRMGFERLYAELIIMLGDEAYTRAFASRFDLAQTQNNTFLGQKFEGDSLGINLSGGAGHEMYTLYQAVQYHQMVLDRFYALSKGIHYSLTEDLGSAQSSRREQSFINQKIVTIYFDRLIKASTQKGRAWGEISKRYLKLNRPQLARRVIERAYVSTYLESLIFSRLMDDFGQVSPPEDKPQINQVVQRAQLSYKVALMDMRAAYQEISDDLTLFGFAPDYIPFPVLSSRDANAFERAMSIAQERGQTAADKEVLALASNRSKKVSMAEFQNELRAVASNFESELADLCGTVAGSDGTIYPAIPKYVDFYKDAGVLGALDGNEDLFYMRQLLYQDPCGRFGSGQLFQARLEVQNAALDYQVERQKWKNLLTSIDLANERVNDFCAVSFDITENVEFSRVSGQADSLAAKILETEHDIDSADRGLAAATEIIGGIVECANTVATAAGAELTGKAAAYVASGVACAAVAGIGIAHGVNLGVVESYKKKIRDDQADLSNLEDDLERIKREWEHSKDCEVARIDLNEQIGNLVAEILTQKIEIQKAILRMTLAESSVQGVIAKIGRTQAEYKEAENMSINLAAAKNDPNVRIYKNDAVITADRTFQDALTATYKATKVFEYYTGQSYAALDKLFLIRTVTFGDYNLESYLADLQNAYIEFQETYGVADLRLMVVSVREDIFQTMLYGADGLASSQQLRDEDFRRLLTDSSRLDENGYVSIPFSTSLSQTSPLTHNHKVVQMQAELVYAGQTDAMARLYVRQKGTGQVRTSTSERNLYRFPERTAVINPFFNGRVREMSDTDIRSDELNPDIYRTLRFRDLPLVNTSWDLVLNLRNEQVNLDIDPNKLKDIRLYIYYSDFTNL